jgi:hypothetical protein
MTVARDMIGCQFTIRNLVVCCAKKLELKISKEWANNEVTYFGKN